MGIVRRWMLKKERIFDVEWIYLAHDSIQWRTLVNTDEILVPQKTGCFVSS
jgi:hypothetical protein